MSPTTPNPKEFPMKRKASAKKAAPKKANPGTWLQYLPAIITATTALLEVLLKHFKP